MPTNYILIGILILLAIITIILYNTLIRRKNEVDNAFGSIDAMLKKRYDLIPNLVEVTKQYMIHEKEILTNITKLRAQINTETSSDEKLKKYNTLQKQVDGVMLNVENYPDLKANQLFLNLQASWNSTEEQISAARRYFNTAVTNFNNSIQMFPSNLIAGVVGYKEKQVFEISAQERKNLNAKDLFNK